MAKYFGKRLVNSLSWIVGGIILFIISLLVLFFNEGRTDYTKLAMDAIPYRESGNRDDFVFVTGNFVTNDNIKDLIYLQEDQFLILERKVEMYAWSEKKETDQESETIVYQKSWQEKPVNYNKFRDKEDHENPAMTRESFNKTVNLAKVAEFDLLMQEIVLSKAKFIKLSADNVDLTDNAEIVASKNSFDPDYIYLGKGTLTMPEIGDIRISYAGVKLPSEVTVFGKVKNGSLIPSKVLKEKQLYRLFVGDYEDAFFTLQSEYKSLGWAMRFLGLLIMWAAIMLILRPVSIALEVLPVLTRVSKLLLAIVALLIAIPVTIIVTLSSSILHSAIGLILVLTGVIFGTYWYKSKKNE